MELNYVLEVLSNNGIDNCYFEEMGGKEIEGGSEEWMDVISEVIGKSSYDDSEWEEGDNEKIMEFIKVMEINGIELI